jgi:CRP/FNR family transcriptional regulator, cyclic AMP receptor protein
VYVSTYTCSAVWIYTVCSLKGRSHLISAQDTAQLLRRVDILESLSREQLEQLSLRIPEVRLNEGQLFYTPSHFARVLFLLLEGRMRIYKMVSERELTLDVVESGTMFGEATLAGQSEGAYAETLEPSRIALLSLNVLGEIVRSHPEVGLRVAELLAQRLRLYADKLADIALKNVPARLAGLLLWLVEIEGTVSAQGYSIPSLYTHDQLGSMIGATRVAVTRAMGKLRDVGAVEVDRKHVLIKDTVALARIARVSS